MEGDFKLALRKQKTLILNNGKSPLGAELLDFAEQGGTGIALFFMFLKYSTICFFFMSILSLYPLITFQKGNGIFKDQEKSVFDYERNLALLTLGNFGGYHKSTKLKEYENTELDLIITIDYCYTVLYLFFYIWFKDYSKIVKNTKRMLPSYLFDAEYKYEKKYYSKQERINDKINEIFNTEEPLMHNEYQSVKAIVVFEYQYIRNNAFKQLKQLETNQFLLNIMPQIMFKCKGVTSQNLIQGIYSAKVNKNVDQPNDIRWENIEITKYYRYNRGVVVIALLSCFLILCFVFIIYINLYRPNYDISLCTQSEWRESEISWNYLIIPNIKDKQCSDAFITFLKSIFISAVIGSFILLVNSMLKWIIKKFQKFLRYSSVSQEVKHSTMLIFWAQFVNTGLLIAFLNFDFWGLKLPEIIIYLVSYFQPGIKDNDKITYINDFNQEFYISSGGKIILTMMINIVSPLFYSLLGTRIIKKFQRFYASKKKTQREMDKKLIPFEFDLATAYAVALNTTFISLFYSSGIPLLIPIGFVALLSQYWSLKYRLLRFNKKPPSYDASLNKRVIQIMPVFLLIHCFIGLFMYSQSDVISKRNDGTMNYSMLGLFQSIENSIQNSESEFLKRITYNYCYFFFFVILFLTHISLNIFYKYFKKFMKCIKKKNKVQNQVIFKSYQDAYPLMAVHNIASYDIRKNITYKYLIEAIDRGCEYFSNQQNQNREQLLLEEQKRMESILEAQQQAQQEEEEKLYQNVESESDSEPSESNKSQQNQDIENNNDNNNENDNQELQSQIGSQQTLCSIQLFNQNTDKKNNCLNTEENLHSINNQTNITHNTLTNLNNNIQTTNMNLDLSKIIDNDNSNIMVYNQELNTGQKIGIVQLTPNQNNFDCKINNSMNNTNLHEFSYYQSYKDENINNNQSYSQQMLFGDIDSKSNISIQDSMNISSKQLFSKKSLYPQKDILYFNYKSKNKRMKNSKNTQSNNITLNKNFGKNQKQKQNRSNYDLDNGYYNDYRVSNNNNKYFLGQSEKKLIEESLKKKNRMFYSSEQKVRNEIDLKADNSQKNNNTIINKSNQQQYYLQQQNFQQNLKNDNQKKQESISFNSKEINILVNDQQNQNQQYNINKNNKSDNKINKYNLNKNLVNNQTQYEQYVQNAIKQQQLKQSQNKNLNQLTSQNEILENMKQNQYQKPNLSDKQQQQQQNQLIIHPQINQKPIVKTKNNSKINKLLQAFTFTDEQEGQIQNRKNQSSNINQRVQGNFKDERNIKSSNYTKNFKLKQFQNMESSQGQIQKDQLNQNQSNDNDQIINQYFQQK